MLETMKSFSACDIEQVFTQKDIPKVKVRYLPNVDCFEVTDLIKNTQIRFNDYNEIVDYVKKHLE